jgi:outer membrane protein OmpA-like peptidoglycan-associated protein
MSLQDLRARHLVIMAGLACAVTLLAPAAGAQQYDLSTSNVTVDLSVLNDGGRGAAVQPVERMPFDATVSPPASGLRLKIPGETAPHSTLHVAPPAAVARTERQPQTAAASAAAPVPRVERRETAAAPPAQPPAPPRQTASAPPAPPRQAAQRERPAPTPDARGTIMPAQTLEAPQTASAAPQPPAPPSMTPPAAPAISQAVAPPPPPSAVAAAAPPAQPTAQPPAAPRPQASLQAARTTGDATKPGEQLRIPFGAEETKIPAAQIENLKALSGRLKATEDLRLQLMAYAGDADMPASKARRLSLSRALAVRSFLIENGIRSTRIDVRALGNKAEDEPRNRVDVVIAER